MQYRSKTGLAWLAPIAANVTANVGPINLNWMMTGPRADFWPNSPVWTGQFYSENTPMRILAWRGQVVEGLKNAEIGYTIPLRWSERISAKRIRFYANGFNLITWDKMKNKGYDPEVLNSNFNSGPLGYPIYKVFNFGVNVVF